MAPLRRPLFFALGAVVLSALACGGQATSGAEPVASSAPVAASAAPQGKYAATENHVSWKGAAGAKSSVTRSEPEARALATDLWRRATAGESLEALAKEHSDGTEAPRGGRIGVFAPGTMVPAFEQAVAALEVGAVGAPFQSPFGWHVVRRDPVVEIVAREILVSWKGAWRSASTRSQDEARARAEAALARIRGGEDFAAVAREISEDPSAVAGGDLGPIAPGQLVPAFEEAAFALEVGERSPVVETPYGFYLIERTR